MALQWKDRVLETSTTAGTGAFTLAGAVAGFQTFAAVSSVSDTMYYFIEAINSNGVPTGEWEVGLGTYSGANTLTRTTVHASSNAGAAVNFSAGTKRAGIAFTSTAASNIPNTPAGNIAATTVQAAINELDGEKLAVASNLSDVANAGSARMNLGLVAGGAGDVWVEKAGDTMTGALNVNAEITAYGNSSTDIISHTARNDSSDNVTTKTVTSRFRGTDTIGSVKDVSYIRAIPVDANWVDGDLSFYTRFADSVTEKARVSGAGHFQMGGANTVIDSDRLHRLRQYTVATLPTVGTAGRLAAVTDASAPTYNATVAGGGAVNVPVYDNGSNWTCH